MFTVALIGADGAGKSTVGQRVASTLSFPIRYLYMGDNPDAANRTLPTQRLLRLLRRRPAPGARPGAPPDPSRPAPRPVGAVPRLRAAAKAAARLAIRISEEWFRQGLAWYYQRRGFIVLFDRHFFADYYAHHIAPAAPGLRLSDRIHGLLLARLYPRPDLVICLDAPAEVLFARKPEGTVEALERRRREYFQIQHLVPHFAVVDASRPAQEVVREVTALIEQVYRQTVRRRPAASPAP